MLHVVCYDISNDVARQKMSQVLLAFGTRIQESVFECILDGRLFDRMMGRMQTIGLGDTDRVRIYAVCGRCAGRVQIYGPGDVTREEDFYLI